jgi:hypothetical protein
VVQSCSFNDDLSSWLDVMDGSIPKLRFKPSAQAAALKGGQKCYACKKCRSVTKTWGGGVKVGWLFNV